MTETGLHNASIEFYPFLDIHLMYLANNNALIYSLRPPLH
jgi:hypothetical protein